MYKNTNIRITAMIMIIISFSLLYSQTTIIDSVVSVPHLDGFIYIAPDGSNQMLSNSTTNLYVGDSGEPVIPYLPPVVNSCSHSFLSFELPQILDNCILDSVNIRLYQGSADCNGSSQGDVFPEWNIAGGDTVKCIMSHINYGFSLGYNDWSIGDIGHPNTLTHNIGTITDNGINGYRYLNVTDYVLQDYEVNSIFTQYRIAFEINTDEDNSRDAVHFTTSETSIEFKKPKLYFYYTNPNGVLDETSDDLDLSLIVSPNPLREKGNISFFSNKSGFAQIKLFNVKGQFIKYLFEGNVEKNMQKIPVDCSELSAGIYFVKIQTNQKQLTKKIAIIN